ncbi:hypothetical protein HNQ99_002418 [Rhizorhapis suberifaciens]|uniref:Uncharacterized protein n=1 Tax=Rhizorhapis suberifaciens TaxID=13656 RepID=A0A840HXB6_9SPHN|nr:hypothetical protein [Rhizorhapis suberifaciens]
MQDRTVDVSYEHFLPLRAVVDPPKSRLPQAANHRVSRLYLICGGSVSAAWILMSVLSPLAVSAEGAERVTTACIVTEKWDSLAGQPYLTQEADCNYDAAELEKRLLSIFQWPSSGLSVETLERTFSLPPLKTSYEAPRQAHYTVWASGPTSANRWHVSFTYDEAFVPMDAWRRPRFRKAKRPILINPSIRGDRRVDIDIVQTPKSDPLGSNCFGAELFRTAARRAGWRKPKGIIIPFSLHGASFPPTVSFERGRWNVSVVFDREGKCAEGLSYGTEADPGAN